MVLKVEWINIQCCFYSFWIHVIFTTNTTSHSRLIVFNFVCWNIPFSVYFLSLKRFIPKNNKKIRLAIGWQADIGPTSTLGIGYLTNFQPFANDSTLTGDQLVCQCWANVGKPLATLATTATVGPMADCYLGSVGSGLPMFCQHATQPITWNGWQIVGKWLASQCWPNIGEVELTIWCCGHVVGPTGWLLCWGWPNVGPIYCYYLGMY